MIRILEEKQFDNHRLVSFVGNKEVGFHGYIAIHRGNKDIPAFGATRIWNYTSDEEALNDALRLSTLMTKKLLLANCFYGGAKAALMFDSPAIDRTIFFETLAEIINTFRGGIITGADVGVQPEDLISLSKKTSYVMGIHSDPVKTTIQGVFACAAPCLEEIYGSSSLEGRSVAIQGLGKIGHGLLELFAGAHAKIYVSDINEKILQKVKNDYPDITIVPSAELHTQAVDIFTPCALSNAVTYKNINELQCKIILGSANCQLESDDLGDDLQKKNILYAPDYVVNAGGIISVVDEYEHGTASEERVQAKIQEMVKSLTHIFQESKQKNLSPVRVANIIAGERMEKMNI